MIETYAPVFHYVGVLGACLYLGSYAALQLGFIRGQTYTYAILNACASGAVLIGISSESLRKLARGNSHLAQAIDHSFAGDTRKKLVMAGVLAQKNPSARPIGQNLGEQPTVN